MGYLNDPRELQIRPESGVTLEQDNRFEQMYHWGAAVLDLCNLPVEEYMKPMTVNIGDSEPTVKTYKLKYYVNGTVNKTVSLAAGDEITPYTPSAAGYTFNGWYTDANLTTQFTDTVMPEKSMSVYGEMVPNEYVLSFYNESELISSANVAYNTAIVCPDMPDKTESGMLYTFVWDGDVYGYMPDHDLNVYGHYERVMTSDSFYYGIVLNSNLSGSLNGIESALTEASIAQIEPTTCYPISTPSIYDPEFDNLEEEWFDKFDDDETFTENWIRDYAFSIILVAPQDKQILSVKQGDIEGVDWVGTSYETNYGTITISGIDYKVYGYRTKNYYVKDDTKAKQIYLDIK